MLKNHISIWHLFQNFKREEQNFVIQNEINNLAFLTGDSKSKISKVRQNIYIWPIGMLCFILCNKLRMYGEVVLLITTLFDVYLLI